MFRYGRLTDNENEKWSVITDDDKSGGYDTHKHVTIYWYHEQDRPDLDYDKVKMSGDLTFDIDAKTLDDAIVSVNKFLDLLEQKYEMDLNYTNIFCSGSKGFHLVIPQKFFDPKPEKLVKLNEIHRNMVAILSAECGVTFDMALYQKRHQIRVPNKPRTDGQTPGVYKVPITPEDARALTPERYRDTVRASRQLPVSYAFPTKYFCANLNQLWSRAKELHKEQKARTAKGPAVPDEVLAPFNDGNLPTCVEWMRDGSALSKTAGFNYVSMNLGAFIGRAENLTDVGREALIEAVAKNPAYPSRSEAEKRNHLLNNMRIAQAGGNQFSCGANRAQLSSNPCSGCPVKEAREAEAEISTQIEERDDGYYALNSKGEGYRLTTFTMDRKNEIIEESNDRTLVVGETYEIRVQRDKGFEYHIREIGAHDWLSITEFGKAVSSVSGAKVFARNNLEIAKLHDFINNCQSREELVRNEQAGIHVVTTEEGTEDRVWLEAGWSCNSQGVSSTYTYTGSSRETILSMRGVRPASRGDTEAAEILSKLMTSNRPELVGQMLAWAAACHLKTHIRNAITDEFPLLHLAGIPGSGKTESAIIYSTLTGAHYKNSPMNVEMVNFYPMKAALSETTTIARVFDEFNRGSMDLSRYNKVYTCLKSAYHCQSVATGYAGKNNRLQKVSASVEDKPATSPLIYMGKEATENEELRQRSVIVLLAKSHLTENPEYRDRFYSVRDAFKQRAEGGNPLQRLAKMLVMQALKMSSEEVRDWYEECKNALPKTPQVRDSRTIVNAVTLKMGMKLLRTCCEGFACNVPDLLDMLEEKVVEEWIRMETDTQEREAKWTTGEKLLQTLSTMANLPTNYQTRRLQNIYHYVRYNKKLWICPRQILAPLREYSSSIQDPVEVHGIRAFFNVFKNTRYFVASGSPFRDKPSNDWICLDLALLEEMGVVHAHEFEGSDAG